jgi:hypothetical protein
MGQNNTQPRRRFMRGRRRGPGRAKPVPPRDTNSDPPAPHEEGGSDNTGPRTKPCGPFARDARTHARRSCGRPIHLGASLFPASWRTVASRGEDPGSGSSRSRRPRRHGGALLADRMRAEGAIDPTRYRGPPRASSPGSPYRAVSFRWAPACRPRAPGRCHTANGGNHGQAKEEHCARRSERDPPHAAGRGDHAASGGHRGRERGREDTLAATTAATAAADDMLAAAEEKVRKVRAELRKRA